MRLSRAVRRGAIATTIAAAVAVIPFATPSFATRVVANVPPPTPTSVSAASGNKLLVVSWSDSGTPAYTATARSVGHAAKVCHTKLLSCTISTLVNGTIYAVTVVATNKSGSSAPSVPVTAVAGTPSAPLAVHAAAGVASAMVSWSAPKTTGGAKVTAYVATASPGGFSCSASGTIVSGPAKSCTIAGLTSGASYTVTVVATNSFGTGVPSKPASVTAG